MSRGSSSGSLDSKTIILISFHYWPLLLLLGCISFTQQIFVGQLLSARHHSRVWGEHTVSSHWAHGPEREKDDEQVTDKPARLFQRVMKAVKKVGQSDPDREVQGAGRRERSGQKLAAYVEHILPSISPRQDPRLFSVSPAPGTG